MVLTQGWLGLEPKEPGSREEGVVLWDAIPLSSTLGPWGAGRPRGEGEGAEAPGPVEASESRGGRLPWVVRSHAAAALSGRCRP